MNLCCQINPYCRCSFCGMTICHYHYEKDYMPLVPSEPIDAFEDFGKYYAKPCTTNPERQRGVTINFAGHWWTSP